MRSPGTPSRERDVTSQHRERIPGPAGLSRSLDEKKGWKHEHGEAQDVDSEKESQGNAVEHQMSSLANRVSKERPQPSSDAMPMRPPAKEEGEERDDREQGRHRDEHELAATTRRERAEARFWKAR